MRYTQSHEWVRLEGTHATVGITNYAQKELGEIVYLQLPKMGQKVKKGEEICVLESTKAAADVYAPVSGKITAVNEALASQTTEINKNAESAGWLFKIEMDHPQEYDQLLSASEYHKLIH